MKTLSKFLLLFVLTGQLFSGTSVSAAQEKPVIYVSVVSHNEEPDFKTHPDFTTDNDSYESYRDAAVDFATMLKANGVKYNFQSDWNFLKAEMEHGTEFSNTGGKNLLKWLVEDQDFEVNPHAHESKYSYADVAYLMKELGVTPAKIVGGFIATPSSSSKLEEYQDLVQGIQYDTSWEPDALWGPASGNHTDDSDLWVSGIWRPAGKSNFYEDDSSMKPLIGGYSTDWDGLDDLLEKRENGELDPDRMYTITLMTDQVDSTDPDFIDEFESEIKAHQSYTESGAIEWVTLGEALDIWERDFDSNPTIYSYNEGELSSESNSNTGNNTNEQSFFNDVSTTDSYYEAIEYVYEQGIVEGYSDGTYKPDQEINRAEFTKILIEAEFPGEASRSGSCFSDVSSEDWFAKYICFAKVKNIVGGFEDGTYKPAQAINIAESLKITLLTFFGSVPETDGEWWEKYWDYADDHGYLLDTWASAGQNLTRGEMAELIYLIQQ